MTCTKCGRAYQPAAAIVELLHKLARAERVPIKTFRAVCAACLIPKEHHEKREEHAGNAAGK